MRKFFVVMAAGFSLAAGVNQEVLAGFIGLPRAAYSNIDRIRFDQPTLAPMAYTQFCLRYANECNDRKVRFRGGPVRLDESRWAELATVNREVNARIRPERNERGYAGDKWLIGPLRGDCNDYAVTKRHELMERGWSARNLLLSEVVTSGGEHHLILVVRTSGGDFVLDNLTQQVRPWSRVPYHWVRIQRPDGSQLWSSVANRSA